MASSRGSGWKDRTGPTRGNDEARKGPATGTPLCPILKEWCKKEKCAWWSRETRECAVKLGFEGLWVLTRGSGASSLEGVVQAVAEKMRI